jgi:uncharacterized membrane protein
MNEYFYTLIEKRFNSIFLSISIIFGLGFAIVQPPFQTNDENRHFIRAYSFYEDFKIFISPYKNNSFEIPTHTKKLIDHYSKKAYPWKDDSSKISIEEIITDLKESRNELKVYVKADYISYTILGYFPHYLGIVIGEKFNLPIIVIFYLGRIFSFLICTLIIFYSIMIFKPLKWFFFFISCVPTFMMIKSSYSMDAITISIIMLLFSIICKIRFLSNSFVQKRYLILLLIISFLLPYLKFVYTPTILLVLIIPKNNLPFSNYQNTIVKYLPILICLLSTFYFNYSYSHSVTTAKYLEQPVVNSFRNILENLDIIFLKTSYTLFHNFNCYSSGMIGLFGWTNILPPSPLNKLYLMLLFSLIFIYPSETKIFFNFNIYERLFMILIFFLCSYLLLSLATIIYDSYQIRSFKSIFDPIGGIQGRYFLPPLIFLLLSFRINIKLFEKIDYRKIYLIFIAFVIIDLIICLYTIYKKCYY